jgi:hypothetical protein
VTIDELICSIESDIENARDREKRARSELDAIITEAETAGRRNLTPAEDARSEALFADIDQARAARKRSEARLSKAQEVRADEEWINAQSAVTRATGIAPARRTATVSVGRNERTYRPDTDPNGRNFLLDVARSAIFDDVRSSRAAAF